MTLRPRAARRHGRRRAGVRQRRVAQGRRHRPDGRLPRVAAPGRARDLLDHRQGLLAKPPRRANLLHVLGRCRLELEGSTLDEVSHVFPNKGVDAFDELPFALADVAEVTLSNRVVDVVCARPLGNELLSVFPLRIIALTVA